jgi:hypothetical protein
MYERSKKGREGGRERQRGREIRGRKRARKKIEKQKIETTRKLNPPYIGKPTDPGQASSDKTDTRDGLSRPWHEGARLGGGRSAVIEQFPWP